MVAWHDRECPDTCGVHGFSLERRYSTTPTSMIDIQHTIIGTSVSVTSLRETKEVLTIRTAGGAAICLSYLLSCK
ncbi:hypothetical protein TNCV_4484101 [Trichonephila clavipes]|nr:hypothetical protein TNCV_4484101 [Trichonephila clavipes]